MKYFLVVIVALLFPLQLLAAESWPSLLNQLDNLSEIEKRATVINLRSMVAGEISLRIEGLKEDSETTPDDVRNSLLRTMVSYVEMSNLCKYIGWVELKEFYDKQAQSSADFLFGKINEEEYTKQMTQSWDSLSEIIPPLAKDKNYVRAANNQRIFSSELYENITKHTDEVYQREKQKLFPE